MKRVLLTLAIGATLVPGAARAGPPFAAHIYERILVPMRDGVQLSVDVWRPANADGSAVIPVPVILTLTPYHVLYKALDRREEDLGGPYPLDSMRQRFVPLGYAYAMADVRGTYNSGGCWDYGGLNERHDGYDLVEWLGGLMPDGMTPSPAAAWSNGRVAMIGASYDGTTANAAAVEAPPHLATIVPIASISRWWGYAYQQGARSSYSGESVDIDPPSDTPTDFMFAYGFLPPPDHDRILSQNVQLAMRWTLCDRVEKALHGYDTQPDYDAFWMERDYLRLADRVQAPALVVHGLLDFNVKTWEGTAWYQALPGEKALVLGQWPHASPDGLYSGWRDLLTQWFERWLLDVPNGVEDQLPVHVRTAGGTWHDQPSWGDGPVTAFPLEGGRRTYLDDGALTESEMLRGMSPERSVRVEVPGTDGIHIEGRPVLALRASSDRTSTHFVAVLCDVGPDGACSVISRAFLNARYNASLEEGTDLRPGEWDTYRLEFIDKDTNLAAGHHLELIVASSSLTWVLSDEQRATNTIDLDESALEVPMATV